MRRARRGRRGEGIRSLFGRRWDETATGNELAPFSLGESPRWRTAPSRLLRGLVSPVVGALLTSPASVLGAF